MTDQKMKPSTELTDKIVSLIIKEYKYVRRIEETHSHLASYRYDSTLMEIRWSPSSTIEFDANIVTEQGRKYLTLDAEEKGRIHEALEIAIELKEKQEEIDRKIALENKEIARQEKATEFIAIIDNYKKQRAG